MPCRVGGQATSVQAAEESLICTMLCGGVEAGADRKLGPHCPSGWGLGWADFQLGRGRFEGSQAPCRTTKDQRRRTTGRLHGAEGTSGIDRGTAQGPLSQPLGETSHRNDSMGIPLPTQTRHLPVVCVWNKGGHKSMCSECRGLHCAWVSRGQWWPNGPESARRSLRPWQVGYHLTVEEPLQVMSRLVVGAHPTQTPKYLQTHRSRLGGFQPPGAPGHQSPKETSGGCEQWDSHSTLTHKTALPRSQLFCPKASTFCW